MSEKKAFLTFDSFRQPEQVGFVGDRTTILQQMGNHAWVSISEDQASRFSEQGILVQFFDEADLISVPAALFDPLEAEPQPPENLAAALPTGEESAYFIIQFIGPPEAEWISQIEEAGGVYIQDNPVHAAVFRLTAAQTDQARALPVVRWVGLYHPAFAFSFTLSGRQEPYTAVELHDLHVDPSQLTPTETGTLEVAFFGDIIRAEVRPSVEATGAAVLADTGYSLVVNANEEQLLGLLKVPGVQAVERYFEAVVGNQRAGVIVGVNQVRDFNRTNFIINLDGSGEIAGIIDSGFDAGVPPAAPPAGGPPPVHPDLAGRITINNLYGAATSANTADTLPHGTHVSGTIAGNGAQTAAFGGAPPANPSTIRGMAPAAQVIMHAAHNPALGNNLDFRGFLAGFLASHNAGARVHSNSWGRVGIAAAVTNNTYDNAVSTVIDRFAFLNPESLVVFLSHNQEDDHDHDGVMDQNHLPRESVAKNILCVGACENETNLEGLNNTYDLTFPNRFHFVAGSGVAPVAGNFPISDSANNLAMFSNRGRVFAPGVPVARRRVRPDLVAPGTNITSTGPQAMLPFAVGTAGRPNTAPPAFYYVDSGTSMATPVVAGSALLTRQFYRQDFDQLRRPALLEQVNQLLDRPASASHTVGSVQAWVHRDTAAGQNNIVAARYDHTLARQGNIVQLQANVGDHPSPQLERSGNRTLLLHRASDNTLRLSCYGANLLLVNTFGTNGVVTLAPASSPDDTRRPAMCAHGDQVAVVWNPTGGDNLVIQRFSATTGAALDASPVTLGSVSSTSPYPYIIHNGSRYAVVWVRLEGGNHRLLFRTVDNNGVPAGTQPVIVHQQAAAIREPHMAWNDLLVIQVFQIVWIDSRDRPDGAIYSHMVTTAGDPFFVPTETITVPAGNTIRHPFINRHPDIGNVLLWEDDTQRGDQNNFHFDVYLTFLGGTGLPDGRISGNRLRISDTPLDTAGYACLVDGSGVQPVWQSNDEINSDLLGVYAARLTLSGAFQAQVDPNTPLINSGRYVAHLLNQHNTPDLTAVAMAWVGGDYFLLRGVPFAIGANLQLVHTNADGLPDALFGAAGARTIDSDFGYENVALDFADTNLIAAHTFGPNIKVFLFDNNGNPVNTFGTNGMRDLNENAALTISPGLGHRGTGNDFRIFLAYGRRGDPSPTIRYVVLDRRGNAIFGPRDFRSADGTARHGWYHLVDTDHPSRSIAAWHRRDPGTGNMAVFINRIELAGGRVHTNDIRLTTALAGDSQNAVIAPRPHVFDPLTSTNATLLDSRRREYGVAWQYRPTPTSQWEIRFSCLDRDGRVSAPNDVQVVARAVGIADPALAARANHATDPQLVWHTDGYGLVWLEQSPAGGPHTLFFTVLDINGNPLDLRTPGAAAAIPAAFHQVSGDDADVQNFHLIWNGRTFRLTWVEILDGSLRHMQTALVIPRQQNQPNTYDQPYHHPTSALIRATLINGATNFRHTQLPNIGNNPDDGYGWGRLNLRQSLAPLPPVTFYARDADSVASGHTVRYHFSLPVDTRLLRLTLAWTDPPDVNLVNNLNLRLTAPDGRVFVGNRWGAAGTPAAEFSDPLPTPPPLNPFEGVHNIEQIVVPGNPTLPSGDYLVEVIGGRFRDNAFQQFPGQPFALVFVGSGQEVVYGGLGGGPIPVY